MQSTNNEEHFISVHSPSPSLLSDDASLTGSSDGFGYDRDGDLRLHRQGAPRHRGEGFLQCASSFEKYGLVITLFSTQGEINLLRGTLRVIPVLLEP